LLINEQKKVNASFYLKFGKDELNFYVVRAVKIMQPLSEVFDWRTDILSSQWSAAYVLKKMKEHENETIGDLLMNQKIFTGVGNIIRNEVLYRARVHPLTLVKNMPVETSRKLLKEVRKYAKEFLKEKIAGTFGDNWEVYEQEECPTDASPLKKAILGKTKRKTYYCSNCQVLYHGPAQSK
jgi:endonuclease-8